MQAWGKAWVFVATLTFLLPGTTSVTSAAGGPVTVECGLKLKYWVHVERPTVDAVNRYVCEGKILASSDVDTLDTVAKRQVIFGLDNCPRLPAMVVFGDRDVTEVRELRGDRTRAHQFTGECKRCVITANTSVVNDPRFDAGHFDARFVVKPFEVSPDDLSIILPAGRGLISLRSERTDGIIARGGWAARRCKLVPQPPIFCGGIAGTPCPEGMACVDWPEDNCDPDAGGADCIGICLDGGS